MTNTTHTPGGKELLRQVPEYETPIWENGKVLSKGSLPLWSGKGPLPKVGAYVDIVGPRNEVATVLGFFVDSGWLMLWCERHSDGNHGDLAGTEIRWAEDCAVLAKINNPIIK